MFIVYMLSYYIEVFYYVPIGKILKCGMCWCVLLSYFVVRCVLVTYSRRDTSKTASKPPKIGATSISFQVVMLHIAYDQYYATIQSDIATSSLCYFACQQRRFMLEELLAYEVKPYS